MRPLALRAGARFIVTPARGSGPARAAHPSWRAGRRSRYDTAAFDVGSTVAGLALPGVREHALATRPIGALRGARGRAPGRAGARARALPPGGGGRGRGRGRAGLRASARGSSARACATRRRAAARVGIARAARLSRRRRAPGGGQCPRARHRDPPGRGRGGGARDGAACWRTASGIPFDAAGLGGGRRRACRSSTAPGVATRRARLRARARGRSSARARRRSSRWAIARASRAPRIWPRPASTPCARARCSPPTCARASWGEPLELYRPQRDFLSLLNLGDGRAIGSKWGVSVEGRCGVHAEGLDRPALRGALPGAAGRRRPRPGLRGGARHGRRRHGLRRLRGQGGRVHAEPRAGAAGRGRAIPAWCWAWACPTTWPPWPPSAARSWCRAWTASAPSPTIPIWSAAWRR